MIINTEILTNFIIICGVCLLDRFKWIQMQDLQRRTWTIFYLFVCLFIYYYYFCCFWWTRYLSYPPHLWHQTPTPHTLFKARASWRSGLELPVNHSLKFMKFLWASIAAEASGWGRCGGEEGGEVGVSDSIDWSSVLLWISLLTWPSVLPTVWHVVKRPCELLLSVCRNNAGVTLPLNTGVTA